MKSTIQFSADSKQDWQRTSLPISQIIFKPFTMRVRGLTATRSGLSSGFWYCSEGEFNWHYGRDDEIIYILKGRAKIRDTRTSEIHDVGPGDSICFPAGTVAHWVIFEPIEKFFVIHEQKRWKLLRRIRDLIKRLI